jgi:hypothetical protein
MGNTITGLGQQEFHDLVKLLVTLRDEKTRNHLIVNQETGRAIQREPD